MYNNEVKGSIDINLCPDNKKQTFDGWGTSLCWWANIIGKWSNEEKINEIADLVFSHDKGLGINIVRYNIGAGENPPNACNLRVGADMPCFHTEDGKWNWNADLGQKKVLIKAKERGVNYFEAFSNSPPLWMLKNASTAGTADRRSNLKEDKCGEFADFLTEVVKYFRDELEITFNTLVPFNEPISCWWHDINNQEGCFFDTNKQIELLELIIEKLESKGLTDTSITGPDCWSVFESVYTYGCYTDNIKNHMKLITSHGYTGDRNSRSFLKSIAKKEGKKLWMSEAGAGGTEPHNHSDMTGPLELAKLINEYLIEMEASAWVYWQAIENEQLNHNHGLIHANFSDSEEYWITKQYYAFGNFSKFIKEDSVILESNDESTIAAYNKKTGNIILVITNNEEHEKEYIIDLSQFKEIGDFAKVYRTSADENLQKVQDIAINNSVLKLKAIAKSITTYEVAVAEI